MILLKCVLWSRSYISMELENFPAKLSHQDAAYCKLRPFKYCL